MSMEKMNRLTMMASVIMLGLIAVNTLILSSIKSAIEKTGSAGPEWMGAAVAALLVGISLAHLLGLTNLALQSKYGKGGSILRGTALVMGVLSLFLLAVDVVMLNDIGHEYMLSHDIAGEWRFVFTGHFVHGMFGVLMLVQCMTAGRS
ncbi:MAG: hypothetical protein NUW12_12095 [Firmicutes bacterium]|nr:hypothetical protein [Bacillota bacterium]